MNILRLPTLNKKYKVKKQSGGLANNRVLPITLSNGKKIDSSKYIYIYKYINYK